MKRLFLVFSILLANLAAFAGPIDDNCSTIYDSIIAGDISKAEDAASKVYAQKSACSATNLADLAIIYHQLVDKSSRRLCAARQPRMEPGHDGLAAADLQAAPL